MRMRRRRTRTRERAGESRREPEGVAHGPSPAAQLVLRMHGVAHAWRYACMALLSQAEAKLGKVRCQEAGAECGGGIVCGEGTRAMPRRCGAQCVVKAFDAAMCGQDAMVGDARDGEWVGLNVLNAVVRSATADEAKYFPEGRAHIASMLEMIGDMGTPHIHAVRERSLRHSSEHTRRSTKA